MHRNGLTKTSSLGSSSSNDNLEELSLSSLGTVYTRLPKNRIVLYAVKVLSVPGLQYYIDIRFKVTIMKITKQIPHEISEKHTRF